MQKKKDVRPKKDIPAFFLSQHWFHSTPPDKRLVTANGSHFKQNILPTAAGSQTLCCSMSRCLCRLKLLYLCLGTDIKQEVIVFPPPKAKPKPCKTTGFLHSVFLPWMIYHRAGITVLHRLCFWVHELLDHQVYIDHWAEVESPVKEAVADKLRD